MSAGDARPPIALAPRLGSEIDAVLREAVNPDASTLIEAIQRASRYANVSEEGTASSVSYSRRVITLGIAETVFSSLTSDGSTAWALNWLTRVEPNIDMILKTADKSDLVRRALEARNHITVSPRLRSAIARAREIAKKTRGRDFIDIRHLIFAISEKPGRAFFNFKNKPSEADLAELREAIVESVARGEDSAENLAEWQRLLVEANRKAQAKGSGSSSSSGGPSPTAKSAAPGGAEFKAKSAKPNKLYESEEDSSQAPDFDEEEDAGPDLAEPASESADEQTSSSEAHPDGESSPEQREADRSEAEPEPKPDPQQGSGPQEETSTDFVLDDAELDQDQLERSVLAIGLGRRLHAIWRRTNETGSLNADARAAHEGSRAAFVVHLDAPWGGGKTTFANFLACVLNPSPEGRAPARFLRERYGEADLGGIFLEDPPLGPGEAARLKNQYRQESRRPWITVYFNAWQMEHIKPPWWAFYQVIRQSCFRSIRREGDQPWDPTKPASRGRACWLMRNDQWLSLWAKEFVWRMTNPKVYSLLLTALVMMAIIGFLAWRGWWGIVESKDSKSAGFILENPIGLVLAGLGGITGLWGLAALFTESIVPGTDTLAERLNLGSGDPFGRFRRHFARTMDRVRRPVLVVVDDLDRCEPDFVVDLVRGIQTLLRSPRVVFVILGDRDWIERAFESTHESMNKVDVGPEQTFGARFVEKAIQMSFILPALGDEARLGYVRHVVLGDRASRATPRTPQLSAEAAARLRQFVNNEAARPDISVFDTVPILKQVGDRLWETPVATDDARSLGEVLKAAGVEKGSAELEQLVSETLAIRAASDEDAEREVKHELEALARFFPANPRQIKRIINSITIYYAVAIQRPEIQADAKFRGQLAAWVIIMTEWPQTWRLLASYPDLVTVLTSADPTRALKGSKLVLPGSLAATKKALEPILADPDLMALVTGRGLSAHPALDADQVRKLAQLTPLHSRVRRLPDPSAQAVGSPQAQGAQ